MRQVFNLFKTPHYRGHPHMASNHHSEYFLECVPYAPLSDYQTYQLRLSIFFKFCTKKSIISFLFTGISFAAKIMKATCPDFSEVSNLKEISILRKIPKHLNVLRLEEVFVNRCSRQVTLIFPLMHKNLEEYIRTAEYIGEKRSKEIFYQMMTGINHLHSYKVFHRDIKPENILLRGSLVVIGDMGSLQYIKTKGHHTEYIATRWYRSPECLLTAGYYSWEMDIWAAACVFYETLTGNPLFPGWYFITWFLCCQYALCNSNNFLGILLKIVPNNVYPFI